jgi:hypothetical protein
LSLYNSKLQIKLDASLASNRTNSKYNWMPHN